MIHARRQIREAFRDVLMGLPSTASRVFTGQALPLAGETELPGLVITATAAEGGEQAEVDTLDPVKYARSLPVTVIGYALGGDIEDKLDQIALEVEQAVGTDFESATGRLRALCKNVILVNTTTALEQLNTIAGEIRLTFAVMYRTARPTPQTAAA